MQLILSVILNTCHPCAYLRIIILTSEKWYSNCTHVTYRSGGWVNVVLTIEVVISMHWMLHIYESNEFFFFFNRTIRNPRLYLRRTEVTGIELWKTKWTSEQHMFRIVCEYVWASRCWLVPMDKSSVIYTGLNVHNVHKIILHMQVWINYLIFNCMIYIYIYYSIYIYIYIYINIYIKYIYIYNIYIYIYIYIYYNYIQ